MSPKRQAITLLGFSMIGAILIVVVSWWGSPGSPSTGIQDRLIVGGAFIASSVYGLSLAIRPGWNSRSKKEPVPIMPVVTGESQPRSRRGHHPDCGRFSDHVIRWRGRVLCAGCTGLAVGSVASILLMSLFIAISPEFPASVWQVFLVLGLAMVGAKYLEPMVLRSSASVRLAFNALLVVGLLFVVLGAFQLTGNAIFGLLAIVLSFLFLDTRVQLSAIFHSQTCTICEENCKVYRARISQPASGFRPR